MSDAAYTMALIDCEILIKLSLELCQYFSDAQSNGAALMAEPYFYSVVEVPKQALMLAM